MGDFGIARPGGGVVHVNVNSIARPLTPTIVRTVRGTISRVTDGSAFRKCNPRRNCPFLVSTVVGGSCTDHNVFLRPKRIFIDSKTGDSYKGVNSVLHRSGDVNIASPICPMCVSSGIVDKQANALRGNG